MSQSEELKLNMKVLEKLLNKHLSLILPYFVAQGHRGERGIVPRSVKLKLHSSSRKGAKALTYHQVSSIKNSNRFHFPSM